MSTDRIEAYTPTEDEVREAVDEWMWSRRMWRDECSGADGKEGDRFVARIKAEAQVQVLREAAGDVFDTMLPSECAEYLRARADRIEKEAKRG